MGNKLANENFIFMLKMYMKRKISREKEDYGY